MSANIRHLRDVQEEFLAELTEAAYRVALRHGLKGSFLEAELELWGELGHVLRRRGLAPDVIDPVLVEVA